MQSGELVGGLRGFRAGKLARDALRATALSISAALVSRPLLRATIGRWPTKPEVDLFHAAFARPHASVPPVIRALASVPAARPQLSRAMLVSWMTADAAYRGELTRGLDSHAAHSPGDVLSVWNGRPVAFLHLEKTAGMTVSRVLEAQFHPTQINADVRRACPDHVMRRYALIRGHFDLPTLRRIDPDRFVLTFLREPRSRILSLYYYWRSYAPQLRPGLTTGVRLAAEMPLLDWLRDGTAELRDGIDNHYVRRLIGAYVEDEGGDRLVRDPQRCLDEAADAMSTLGFIGTTERMDASLAALGRALGFPRPMETPRVNVTGAAGSGPAGTFRAVEREPITPEIEAELGRLTRLDSVLYARALAGGPLQPTRSSRAPCSCSHGMALSA